MNLIPLGVIWAGYALIWYGRVLTIGAGLGIADLVIPSHIPKARAWLTDKHTGTSGIQTTPDPGTKAVDGNQIGTPSPAPGQSGPIVPQPPSGKYPSTPPSRAG